MLIGITGVIGSGKSMVGEILKKENYLFFDCDEFVKEAYQDKDIIQALDKEFNCKNANKQDIKKTILEQPSKVLKLNEIIHPYVFKKIIELKNKYQNELLFMEIPLLFECELQTICDYTLTVVASKDVIEQRLKNRNIENYSLMRILMQFQLNQETKAELADQIVENTSTIEELEKNLHSVIANFK